MSNEYAKEVAEVIRAQLLGRGGSAMIGAYNLAYSEEDGNPFLSLRWKAKSANKSNYLKVVYDVGMDLYNLEFGRIHGMKYRVIKELEGVYADMLREIFENETGLYLSL